MTQKQVGYFQVILSGVFFGLLGTFGKIAYQKNILPGELLGLRFLTSAIIFGLLLSIFKKESFKMSLNESFISLALGIFGYAVFSSCYFFALQGVSASLTVLLLYTYPIVVTIGARIFFKEHIGFKGIIALIISTVGMIALAWGEWDISGSSFIFYGLASSFFYAIYILISRKTLDRVNFLGSSFYVQLGAGLVLCSIHFKSLDRPIEILTQNSCLVIGMAIICSLFPLTLFLAGLQKLSAPETSILSTTEALFGVLIASLYLKERMSLLQILGGLLVIIGAVLIATKAKKTS
jgi:drug/metabolite transporter (DMT)-like permease